MAAAAKRPPSDRGQGRKSVQGGGKSPVLQVVVSPEQKAKVERLGGAVWVRGMIDRAKESAMGLFDVGGKFKPRNVAGVKSSRFIEPHDCEEIDEFRIKYDNAEKLAEDLGPMPLNFRAFVILDGKFIFGDYIEALIVKNNWHCEELTISTLSLSEENVDSLANLVNGGFLKQLSLIVSHYYFANERSHLMPYIYEQLDVGDVFQLAVASVHTKIAMIRTACGKKITIHGSANLRTSSNIEQIVVEHTPGLFDFCAEVHHNIIEKHKTINKPVRRTALWSAVLGAGEPAALPVNTNAGM